MYLLETNNRPTHVALMYTAYHNTTGLCIRLAYAFIGGVRESQLKISAVAESKQVSMIGNPKSSGLKDSQWYTWTGELPPGTNMIMIEGTRGTAHTSGIAFDDLSIGPCESANSKFQNSRKPKKMTFTSLFLKSSFIHLWFDNPCYAAGSCMVTKLGREYKGVISSTKSDHKCLPWSTLADSIADLLSIPKLSDDYLPDASISTAEDYCRSLATFADHPGCFTSGNVWLQSSFEQCDVNYCGEYAVYAVVLLPLALTLYVHLCSSSLIS